MTDPVPPEAYEAARLAVAEHDGDWFEDRDFLSGAVRRSWRCRKCGTEGVDNMLTHYIDVAVDSAAPILLSLGVTEGRHQAAEAIRADDLAYWPGGRMGEVRECQKRAARIAEGSTES